MKKRAILIFGLLVMGSMVFAYDLSVGGGLLFGYVNDKWEDFGASWDEPRDLTFSRMQFGGFAFFGTRYTEFNFTIRLSNNDIERRRKYGARETDNFSDTLLALSVGGYAKYPFTLSETFVLFPTIGIDFDATEDLLYLWFRGGVGIDYFFSERFFLRGQALYGYGINLPYVIYPTDFTIKPGHGPLFKVGLGWMF